MEYVQNYNLVESVPVFLSMNTITNKTSLDLERPKLKINRFVASAQNGNINRRESLKTAPPRYNLKSSTNKSSVKSRETSSIKKPQETNAYNSKTRFTIRERQIKDWAFKKINLNEILKSNEFTSNNSSNKDRQNNKSGKHQHDVWFDEDDIWLGGPQRTINLAEYEDADEEAEFYRKHRNSGMNNNKNDAEKNILYKLLDSKLIDLSKDRFKLMSYVDYQKKLFIKKQLMKSKSLPGLKCLALEQNLPRDEFDEYKATTALSSTRKQLTSTATTATTTTTTGQSDSQRKKLHIKTASTNKRPTTTASNPNPQQKPGLIKENTIADLKNEETESFGANFKGFNTNSKTFFTASNSMSSKKNLTINFIENNSYENKKYLKKESLYRLAYKNNSSNKISNLQMSEEESIKSPVVDYRFNNLISVIKPSYMHKEMKDVNKIIEKNEALKSVNLNSDIREKMKKVKQNGTKLANTARLIIASGEYIQ